MYVSDAASPSIRKKIYFGAVLLSCQINLSLDHCSYGYNVMDFLSLLYFL
jgi:hypothetical protein